MKRILSILLVMILTLSVLSLTACDEDKKEETKSTSTKPKASSSQPKDSTDTKADSQIQSYLDSFVKGDSDFYGAWQMKGMENLIIIFRNDKMAEMVMGGTEGYFSKYTLDESKKTVTVQLIPDAIDGTYTYEFSQDKNKLTLTLDGSKLEFSRDKDFTIVPKPPKKAEIDKNLLGWWENTDGFFYCFQENGIMYENSISMETCYTYNASDGKIKAVYSSAGEMDENFTYSFKNGELTINDSKCTKKDMN